MSVRAKICGINDAAAMRAALEGGASHVGLVFYPPSPRALAPAEAAPLAALAAGAAIRVGLFVDADDLAIDAVLREVALDMLQLHGAEPPERVAALRQRTGLPVMKAIKVAEEADLAVAEAYFGAADWLMFDAKPPRGMKNALPGGNALSFDWMLVGRRDWPRPWMLAGGIDAANVGAAVRLSHAPYVDTSSGVEDAPGRKNPARIRAFLAAVAAL